MSARNLDKHNRFRCITVGFRVSPEEHEHINKAVTMSGLSKQEYCYRRCLERDIVVQGNPKVCLNRKPGYKVSPPLESRAEI